MRLNTIDLRLEHDVAVLTLQPPDQRNPMTEQMSEEFPIALRQAADVLHPAALVITGAGDAFSAGGAYGLLEGNLTRGEEACRALMLRYYQHFLQIRDFSAPVVAAVNGAAVGAGAGLALACDLRIAAQHATFSFPFIKLGLSPGLGISYLLPRFTGLSVASDLLLTGRKVGAEEALRLGLVNRLSTTGDLVSEAIALARSVTTGSPQALRDTRRLLGLTFSRELNEALEHEAACQARQFGGEDIREGLAAAREKRLPRFRAGGTANGGSGL